ncbi:MAG: flagellin [Gallionella sp.]|nr:flagellin [Gallionella sp.]
MPAIINTNIASLNAQRNLNSSQSALQTSLQRLSSGLRINSAKDDAAGLAISERFSTQIRGLNQAARNANDGISLAQTGEGALSAVTDNLQRIRELAVQAANSTNSAGDRAAIQLEVAQRLAEIDRTASQTSFNGQKLLDGSFGNANFQIGANAGEVIGVGLATNMRTSATGAVATTTSAVLGAGATGGSAITGAITAADFSVAAIPTATAGSLTLNPATRLFGTAAATFDGGTNSVNTVATTDFSVAGTALTAGHVDFTATDFNFQALVGGTSQPLTVNSFDNDGTSAAIVGYNSQVVNSLTPNFSGAALAQFNVSDGTNTASITLNTAFGTVTALAAELQTQVRLGGGQLATATVTGDNATGALTFSNNVGQTNAISISNADANAIAAGFVASAGVAGAAADTAASFQVDGTTITMATNSVNITGFAAELTSLMQASALGADYSAAVVSGKIVITNAGAVDPVDITASNAKALASGITNVAGVTGTAASDPSTIVVDGNTVTLDQNYLSFDNMAAAIETQLGAAFTVSNTAGAFTISRVATGAASTAIDITGDAASDTAGITAAGARAGVAGTDLVASTNANFTVGATAVSLTTNLTDRAGVLAELQSQLAGYNVTDTGTGYEFKSLNSSAAVAISGADAGAAAAGFVNTAGVAGTAAQTATNATFTIDGQAITLNTDFASYDAMATGAGGLQEKLTAAFGAGVYTVANNAGAITISKVATGAVSTAPDITVADAASETAGLGVLSGTATPGADADPGTSVALTIDGQAISLVGTHTTVTDVQGELQSALDTAFAANAYTVSVNGSALEILNNTTGSAAVSITADNAAATTAGFGTIASSTAGVAGGSVTLADLTINGSSLAGTYASSTALATAINSQVSGVFATVSNGALSLTSAADITFGGAADVVATGLNGGLAGTLAANSGSLSGATVATVADANLTIQRIDSALNAVSTLRSTFGAIQNRFESVISSLSATSENLTAARSRIQDTDFAAETAQLTRNQILQQAGTAMLAQANQLPNTVLSLLR